MRIGGWNMVKKCDEKIKQPKWKIVENSRSQIINAGKTIRNEDISNEERNSAIKVIDNWRAAHAFPMHVIYMHLRRMCSQNEDVIVAERLKRLKSITNKLKREKAMNLWTMQDLGGCRVIVPKIFDVYKYAKEYENSKKRHIQKKVNDYIANPKKSGYRSLHIVYQYHSDKNVNYNKNMLVEIQFRTHLQHLWATAVETMDLFKQEAIKSGQGSSEVRRFFLLASAVFATIEQQPLPPNVPASLAEIKTEIDELNKKHKYLSFLSGVRVAVENQQKLLNNYTKGYYILILNYTAFKLSIRYFGTSRIEEATATYNNIEESISRNSANIDAVLVHVSSFKTLKSAFPNYFSDIGEFIDVLNRYML